MAGAINMQPVNLKNQEAFSERWVSRLSGFLAGGSFPAFALMVLVFYQIFIALMAFAPPANGPWGEFVEEFRIRCFSFDPDGDRMAWSSVWMMVLEPIPMEALLFFIWRAPLRELWMTNRRRLAPLAGAALILVGGIAVSLLGLKSTTPERAELPFPADRLRSALPMPPFDLTDQEGARISLESLKGRVVLVTAVYSTCTTSCPMMLTKIRAVLGQLTEAERSELSVVAFSLNPETDTRELRSLTANMYGMHAPQFHFVNGLPAEVDAVLDRLSVYRSRDEATGQIQHSNLFFLLDREGRIAYRLSLSQNEQSWLGSALRVLISEKSS